MRVKAEMKLKEVLTINENMIQALVWLSPDFERLRDPLLSGLMAGRMSVKQAARIADVPISEALYVLNLTAGEDEKGLILELENLPREYFECTSNNALKKPRELSGLADDDPRVHFIDVTELMERNEDPQTLIVRELRDLSAADEVLLVRQPLDPIPLRDLLTMHGFESWAEERNPYDWYIYFYRPHARAGASAPLLLPARRARAMARGASG